MSEVLFSMLWCAVQVSVIAGLACLFSVFVMKGSAKSAARLLAGTSLVLLGVTVFVALPIPDWSSSAKPEPADERPVRLASSTVAEPIGSDLSQLPRFRFPRFALNAVSSVREVTVERSAASATWWLMVPVVGVLFGLVRVAGGFWSLRCLRRSSVPIGIDEPVHEVVTDLAAAIGIVGDGIPLSESAEIDCAAVLGFRRSTILLATNWREWSDEELRAVLAHELAHVARRDAFWRMVAVLASAVHFFNPLVHWLTSRTVLAQELAADQLALQSVGQGDYVRSLSRLALRHDSTVSSTRVRTRSLFTPVFAGHLMRRIEMLVAKDCGEVRHGRRWVSPLFVCVIAGLAVVSTAARGLAGPQEKKSKDSDESPIRTVSASADKKASSKFAFFSRPTAPSNHATFASSGAIHLVMEPVLKTPAFRGALEPFLQAEIFATMDLTMEDVSNVESLSSGFLVAMGTNPGSDPPGKNSLQFGATGLSVRTKDDVDWMTAIPARVAGATKVVTDDVTYFKSAPLGIPVRIVACGPRELRSFNETPSGQCLGFEYAKAATKPTQPDWKPEWEFLSGGMLTTLWRVQKPRVEVAADDRWGKLADKYNKQIDICGYAIDIRPDLSQLAIRVRLRCCEGVAADEVKASVVDVLAEVRKEVNTEGPNPMSVFAKGLLTLAESKLTTGRSGDREHVSCEFEVQLPEIVQLALKSKQSLINTKTVTSEK